MRPPEQHFPSAPPPQSAGTPGRCSRCGSPLRLGARYCTQCGTAASGGRSKLRWALPLLFVIGLFAVGSFFFTSHTHYITATAGNGPMVASSDPMAWSDSDLVPDDGDGHGDPFRLTNSSGEPLVGFDFIPGGGYRDRSGISQLTPIFRGDSVFENSHTVIAPPGWAVGGLIVNGSDQVRAIQMIFQRIEGDHLENSRGTLSQWIGNPTDRQSTPLRSNGKFVTGIRGYRTNQIESIGLIYLGR